MKIIKQSINWIGKDKTHVEIKVKQLEKALERLESNCHLFDEDKDKINFYKSKCEWHRLSKVGNYGDKKIIVTLADLKYFNELWKNLKKKNLKKNNWYIFGKINKLLKSNTTPYQDEIIKMVDKIIGNKNG